MDGFCEGEDVCRSSANAAGEQTGRGRQSQERSNNKGGTEAGGACLCLSVTRGLVLENQLGAAMHFIQLVVGQADLLCQKRTDAQAFGKEREESRVTGSLKDITPIIYILQGPPSKIRMEAQREKTNTCCTICLKYLLFTFNILFWLAGGAVLAVGVWTLVEKSDYISLLNSSFYSSSAYILIAAGIIVIATGIIGCCATLKEMKSLLIVYLILLLCIFLLEIIAGVLAYIKYQECFPFCYQLDEDLRQNLKVTMQQKYQQPGEESITQAVDKLHQEFKCCGSNSSSDWADSVWIQASKNEQRVPDSCCKTPSDNCGVRDHPSNIYRVEGGCIMKLEDFILSQLYILGAVGIGIAFLQLVGMMLTCCLYQNLKEDPY
ncbi:hypothetical protein LDENG_00072220 [Lucifuga dentata]|nr:hypothetical protein LDENG_00072220 [Lucifuga dentata]